jgi:hypothetical protein
MKYHEYQAWFHAFNNAYAALCQLRNYNITPKEALFHAEEAAEVALKKFKEVETPEQPDMSNIDLAELVTKVAGEATKKR